MDSAAVAALIAGLDRELWVVTSQGNGRRGGLIATFVSPASIVPDRPRMLVGLARQHHTWELVEESGAFGLHLLGPHHLEWVWRFGLASGRDADKLAGLEVHIAATGSPLLTTSAAWLDCRVEDRLHTGDRTVYLATVVESSAPPSLPPLTLQQLLRQAPPAKLAEMKRQRDRDSLVDSAAIRAWRV